MSRLFPGKDRDQKEKEASEDEMAGRHHRCNDHEVGQPPGDGEGQGGLACCSSWGRKESDTAEQLNNNNNKNEDRDFPYKESQFTKLMNFPLN